MMKRLLILLVYCFTTQQIKAQDIPFYNYNASKTNLNPAFAGSDSAFILSTAGLISASPATENFRTFFSLDNYFRFLRGGLAFNFGVSDEKDGGAAKMTLAYAPHFEFFNHRLAFQPAIEFGYFESQAQSSQPFPSQWNYENPDAAIPGHFGINGWDVTTGFLLFTKNFTGELLFII